jgi:hypothetical protein
MSNRVEPRSTALAEASISASNNFFQGRPLFSVDDEAWLLDKDLKGAQPVVIQEKVEREEGFWLYRIKDFDSRVDLKVLFSEEVLSYEKP